MAQAEKHKSTLLRTAAMLFRRKGYSGTGLKEILEISGAPKGSLYHYFPGGKEDIGVAVVLFAGDKVTTTLTELASSCTSASHFIESYTHLLAGWMQGSNFEDGCPITTILLEMSSQSPRICEVGNQIMDEWLQCIIAALEGFGWANDEASEAANLGLSALEGALILSRVKRSVDPVLNVGNSLSRQWQR